MPLYEYQCRKCGHLLEVIQKFSDAPLTECPECAGKLDKLLSAPAIQFKGTGWYVTDYADKGKDKKGKTKESKPSSKDSEDTSKKSTEKKSDSSSTKDSKTTSSKGSDKGSDSK